MGYSIGQVSQKMGLTAHTLRYYEKEGLLPFVKKNGAGLRVFSDNDLGWLELIECLKGTGMTLKGIKQYIDWFQEGDSTLKQRLEMAFGTEIPASKPPENAFTAKKDNLRRNTDLALAKIYFCNKIRTTLKLSKFNKK